MNRLNALRKVWWNAAEASTHDADASRQYLTIDDHLIPPDRDLYKRAVAEQHTYCDIAGAIRHSRRYA